MSATEELRALLDERGVEYETHDVQGMSETIWNGFAAYQLTPNAKLIMHPTPEQAIAATLGTSNETAKVLIDDMLDFIGNCCETTLDCDCCDPVDCKYINGCGELAECTKYQDFLRRAKAIAAALGGGECENLIDPWSVHETFENDFECSACHASGHANGNIDHGVFLYCPRCGAKVRKAVKR